MVSICCLVFAMLMSPSLLVLVLFQKDGGSIVGAEPAAVAHDQHLHAPADPQLRGEAHRQDAIAS